MFSADWKPLSAATISGVPRKFFRGEGFNKFS